MHKLFPFTFSLACLTLFAVGCQTVPPEPKPVACTMEAKLCPDGSYVGRSGPKCEFAACPTPKPTPVPTPNPVPTPGPVGRSCSGQNDQSCGSGYVCFQDCGPPVVREGEPPAPYHCQTEAYANKPRMCPICLASNTLIATPTGEVKVTDLKLDMNVWSPDGKGGRVAQRIVKLSHTPVPPTHKVVHLVLSDAREAWVSPNHPLMSGQPIASLHVGDVYDGAEVVSAELIPYWDTATYDLLPDGATGAYWANGIPLRSTLSK